MPQARRIDTPVSHVDALPTILELAGERVPAGYPGYSLLDIAHGADPERTVLSEYHGMGSATGAFAIRMGKWKYVHYVGYPPQLFDLDSDPDEIHDLGTDARHAGTLEECRRKLFALLDPVEVDRRAKARQAQLLAENGGRDAVIQRGDFGFTPGAGNRGGIQIAKGRAR